jgi:hypothetical protein
MGVAFPLFALSGMIIPWSALEFLQLFVCSRKEFSAVIELFVMCKSMHMILIEHSDWPEH